jgi:RNA 3'-terminal phosphate cyclase (ATP)
MGGRRRVAAAARGGNQTMITIDGSQGEGGGQVIRTSLALSLVTGQPMRISQIRAGRKTPGLLRQHLTAVRAASEISGASVSGDEIGSRDLVIEPGAVRPGQYTFAIGTAGSATLVLQTVLPALMTASGPSRLVLKGGTHNPWAPPFDFLEKTLLPLLARMGPQIDARLVRPGFYPAGGGEFTVDIHPAPHLAPLELMERGETISRTARALVARLAASIGERELSVVGHKLGWPRESLALERVTNSVGPGNAIILQVECRNVTEVFTGFGQLNVRSEAVAARVVDEVRRWLAAGVPVGEHLADQLLVPMALAGGRFRTVQPSRHTETNIAVIGQFVGAKITSAEISRDVWEIVVTTN